jgi:hypothetical protein
VSGCRFSSTNYYIGLVQPSTRLFTMVLEVQCLGVGLVQVPGRVSGCRFSSSSRYSVWV